MATQRSAGARPVAQEPGTEVAPEEAPLPPLTRVAGSWAVHARTRVVFPGLPDRPHTLTVDLAFPQRGRWMLAAEDAGDDRRVLAYRCGPRAWTPPWAPRTASRSTAGASRRSGSRSPCAARCSSGSTSTRGAPMAWCARPSCRAGASCVRPSPRRGGARGASRSSTRRAFPGRCLRTSPGATTAGARAPGPCWRAGARPSGPRAGSSSTARAPLPVPVLPPPTAGSPGPRATRRWWRPCACPSRRAHPRDRGPAHGGRGPGRPRGGRPLAPRGPPATAGSRGPPRWAGPPPGAAPRGGRRRAGRPGRPAPTLARATRLPSGHPPAVGGVLRRLPPEGPGGRLVAWFRPGEAGELRRAAVPD